MGAEGWHYFAPYRGTVARSLEELRQQEFRARRFHHSELPSATIDEATENAGESGTRSILDIQRMSDSPADWAACPVPAEVLCQEFGSERPSRQAIVHAYEVEDDGPFDDFFDGLERGQACYIVAYQEGRPTEVFFAGWSVD